ncbi:hypothetical protein LCGC14_0809270 [marine sediment metagenome]|uniref:Gliding-motility protein MglA n=1 Tax=marine sediment metagenome TaxID=412755 RepID=A0A0F9PM94_9ZZZZ
MGLELNMIYNYSDKILQVKIVYYGPAMSGKTTSIKSLFSYFNKEDSIKSIDNSVGRTLFFDFGVLQFKGTDWGVKFLIYSATGQDFYASTRSATLKGVDGIIFIVDSQMEYLKHNIRSWKELEILFGSDIYNIPIVISLNKYDLFEKEKLDENEFLSHIDCSRFKYLSFQKTAALNGDGVLNSFNQMIKFIFPQVDFILKVNN